MDMCWHDLLSGSLAPGVYRMDPELAQSLAKGLEDSFYHFTLPKLMSVDKTTLLQAMAKSLVFPDYYGGNWDAAYDCLTDREWPAGTTVLIEIPISPAAGVDEDALTTFVEVLGDACRFWSEQRLNLYCLFVSSRNNLASLSSLVALRLI